MSLIDAGLDENNKVCYFKNKNHNNIVWRKCNLIKLIELYEKSDDEIILEDILKYMNYETGNIQRIFHNGQERNITIEDIENKLNMLNYI